MGSCARLLGLDPTVVGRLAASPPAPPPGGDLDALRDAAEAVDLGQVTRWTDDADNQLSRATAGDGFCARLPAAAAAAALGRPAPAGAAQVMFHEIAPPAVVEAFRGLAALLGLGDGPRRPLPWFVTAQWPLDGFAVGLLDPPAVQALAARLHETRALAAARAWDAATRGGWSPALERLEAFLDAAAARGLWVLGLEGQS